MLDDPKASVQGTNMITAPSKSSQSFSRLHKVTEVFYITFLDFFRRPSVSFAAIALIATYWVKINWHTQNTWTGGNRGKSFMAFIAEDLVFWGILITLFLFVERLGQEKKRVRAITLVPAFFLASLAFLNVFWMRGTGGQISKSVLEVGISRLDEVLPIIGKGLGVVGAVLLPLCFLFPLPFAFLFEAKWKTLPMSRAQNSRVFLVPAILLALSVPGFIAQKTGSDALGWRLVASNFHLTFFHELFSSTDSSPPPRRLAESFVEDAGEMKKLNVVIFLMEATARRATSLDEEGPSTTPFLKKIAQTGLEATQMRTAMPHTSKSIFSILCGRYPALQHDILETASNYPMSCLPKALSKLGYKTAFFQSADGRFEDRPRLVHNFGFREFFALQDLEPPAEKLGYLAAADRSLASPLVEWINEASQSPPFLLTVMTSSTHHNYELPSYIQEHIDAQTPLTAPQRYLHLVNDIDQLIELVHYELGKRGLLENTVFVVMGDHGESFGEHGNYQHDNIFTDEGLRVPFVISAPGVNPTRIDEVASLVDTTPTILDLLGINYSAKHLEGTSLFDTATQNKYFACWYSNVCAGYVTPDKNKFIVLPTLRSWLSFDLDRDPLERQPSIEKDDLEPQAEETRNWYNRGRFASDGLEWPALTLFDGAWSCGRGRGNCVSSQGTDHSN